MKNKIIKDDFKTFRMRPIDRRQLDYISEQYGENKSSVIRRLIERTYTELKLKEDLDSTNKT